MSWAMEELKDADLGDLRRNRRLIRIVEDLAAQPHASVSQASRDAAAMQGVYDFWSNPRISPETILSAHQRRSVERISTHETVLAIQDTSELDFSSHRRTQGLGPLSNPAARGLKVHTVLAASAAGVPLGILHQKVWAREKTRRSDTRRRASIAQKESARWLESLEVSQTLIPRETRVITIADREADMYELFGHPRRINSEFLIRAAQNRSTKADTFSANVQPLFAAIRQAPCQGQLSLELQRTPRRAAREATLSIRFTHLWLQPPAHLKSLSPIAVDVILAEEDQPPFGEKPICWLLLTTLAISDLGAACQSLWWYAQRWVIERYFFTLQSGCRIEELQLERADRLQRALATYTIVAWRLLWLTYEARQHPNCSVEDILEPPEWQALYCTIHQTPRPPSAPPNLGECVRWIAQLGGFRNRQKNESPGIETLWRGLQRLHDIAATWQLVCPPTSSDLTRSVPE